MAEAEGGAALGGETGELLRSLKSLRVMVDGAVALVELVGPGKGNAMGPDFWAELPLVFGALSAERRVRAVLLYGAGGNFSYGLDLITMEPVFAALMGGNGRNAAQRTEFRRTIGRLQQAVASVQNCVKPVIAAIDGWCIGGGVDIAAAADIRIASPGAKFSVREVRMAMVADLGSLQRLPRLIGEAATRHLALTGEDIDAARALSLGLVTELAQDVLGRGRELAAVVAANPPLAVQGVKEVLNFGHSREVQSGLDYVASWNAAFLPSADFTEAMGAFGEQRRRRVRDHESQGADRS
ncbi:crotonase/enoyl-CoA hydratase family protein [Paeniglutamicibacter antarcticus]|uniref:Crotonase/enoyl-CoA hydratase family protein n=1 Tax=Arthrobacter terrae TaxID=2935737 RepID=A0A931CLR2_9MICC|nr:crotonase/enoyl-CoA hydratase family protein [Arthrobacter terrae]MBG0739262.1 crotonase/enoyl-CoA hydratase family protein [Arthrobacter terrae]